MLTKAVMRYANPQNACQRAGTRAHCVAALRRKSATVALAAPRALAKAR
ncbi:hypothetical protein KCP74_24230 [Salmonella enterica subsp. enterica]|nr:hypothetical protein KCP74_24230 [Salmonella enterica subsp. enterica]